MIDEWLADVAELFLEKKHAWSNYFEKKFDSSTQQIEKYFQAVNSLLSKQLRIIVMQSLEHFRDFLVTFRDGNSFDGEYQDFMFIK